MPRMLKLLDAFSNMLYLSPDQIPRWRKIDGGDPIDWNRVTWATNFNKSLKIENVQYSDEGTYECTFPDDPPGRQTKRFHVNVECKKFCFCSENWLNECRSLFVAAPQWSPSAPHSVNSSEEETVEFDCRADGRPEPTYQFYKNGKGACIGFEAI